MIPKKIQDSIWFNILLLAVAVVLSIAAYRAVGQAVALNEEAEISKRKIEDLTLKKKELETKLQELQTSEAQERLAKERLGLKKTGEEVVVVVPGEVKVAEKLDGWFNKFKNFLSNLFNE